MKKNLTQRGLSLIVMIAMLVTLLAGMTFSASAAPAAPTPGDYWTSNPNYYDTSWYIGSSPYSISTAQQLAGLAYLVNTGNTFAGETINLIEDIDLSAHYWYPIGGVSPLVSGVPTGYYFAGKFDGYYAGGTSTYNTHVITGLYIEYIKTDPINNSGYGLFGYVDRGGVLVNLTLGAKNGGGVDLGSNDVSAVGALVGYTSGNIYNVHNELDVTMTNTSSSMLGGIAGTVENPDIGTKIYVQYCSNTGNLTGRGRVGGIVGAVYAKQNGDVQVDNCYNKNNSLTTVGVLQKSYLGGIVGYSRGYITNSYSITQDIETSGGHYQAGIVGLLQGASPEAALSNVYAYSVFGKMADINYDRWLFGSTDNSSTMVIANALWVDTFELGLTPVQITQPVSNVGDPWGAWTNVGYFDDGSDTYSSKVDAMVYANAPPAPPPSGPVSALGILNNPSPLTGIATNFFLQNNPAISNGYPYLSWEVNGVPVYPY